MKNNRYSDHGFVLGRRDYGEADRILVVFTKTQGKASLMAKGTRKPKSRKRGSLEIFNKIKFSAATGKSLDIMTEAQVIDDFVEIRKSLKKASVAYFFIEVIGRVTQEREKNEQVYNLLDEYLQKLKAENKLKELRNSFTEKLLVMLGFWPEGKPIVDHDRALESVTERKLGSIRVGKKLQ